MFKRLQLINLLLAALFVMCLSSCSETNGPGDGPITIEPLEGTHTLIVYMLGNNGLEKFMDNNLKNISSAFPEVPEGHNIVIFYDRGSYTRLMQLYTDENGKTKYDVFYDQASTKPTTTPEFTAEIFKMIREKAPADTYGLIFSSHGGGWVPADLFDHYSSVTGTSSLSARPQFIGQDGEYHMEVPELVEGLKDQPLEYIIFDACLMASVEALYDLRVCADYIIASSAEILGDGFPYTKMIPRLFYKSHGLGDICRDYMDLYRESSGTITLVDCAKLNALAAAMKEALSGSDKPMDASKIQAYEDFHYHLYFDLEQLVEQVCDEAGVEKVRIALREAVPFTDHTEKFYSAFGEGRYIDLPRSCGLTTHVRQSECEDVHEAWLETSWAKAIGAR